MTQEEANRIWERMIEAEVRSFYFGELATTFTRRKQMITGVSFFLSSGAAATLIAKAPEWIPMLLAIISAMSSAYSIALALDKRVASLSKLHSQWAQLSAEYERLWHHWYEEDADKIATELLRRDREVSELGTGEPYNESLIQKWQDRVYTLRGLAAENPVQQDMLTAGVSGKTPSS